MNNFYFLKKIVELQSEHARWSTALTLLISITAASLIALLSSFIELQSSDFFSDKRQNAEKITLNGDLLIPKDSIISDKSKINYNYVLFQNLKDSAILNNQINRDTIKLSNLTFNYVEKKSQSELKPSADQILFSCTTVLSLIFTIFIYIIRSNVERKIERINNDEDCNYEFITDLLDNISSIETEDGEKKRRKKEELDKILIRIKSELEKLS